MAERARAQLRAEALDVAEELVVAGRFGMPELASRLGVSRQTLYNEFGDRHGVTSALVLRSTERFLDGIEAALAGERDLHAAWVAAVAAALHRAADEPLLKALLTGDSDVLGAEPIVVAARDRAAAYLRRTWPELENVDLAAETAARLTVSHIGLPLAPPEVIAEQVATVVVRTCARR
ncbi:TetR family transcriptional regulator [Pseudonocardia sp. WMMC193]|nr:TetR family transcriptional regulator [Pseudonocardia sp. WMMC193]MCF7549773.1 TetR family transcriptional regulator [Pseudonocardia sp. WMMC193]